MYWIPHVLAAFLAALATLPPTTSASQIYTWQDEDGTTHFSDKPHPGASALYIQPPEVSSPPLPSTIDAVPKTAPSPSDAALPLPSIALTSPADQQTLRDNQGHIMVAAVANRKLNQGHSAQLRLDGEPYGRPQTQLTWPLTNIDRGSHTLQVDLLKHGKVIASSEEITVFLHRARINQRPAPHPVPK
ncbi:DUF4124 domain-containing protein [Photobacterium sp. DA100]|uniref:DUF4124 domain-containing protein n=1 Tax=Photobacterium sp. DA100 TaxID=3027472 RepID=UPI00247AE17E|nr:DUF4124 domain-containing protein [Photobacterium sp. DA100]WEM42195.1 DUF4124 domain-containing protein [Photobacterium sp. DA100]